MKRFLPVAAAAAALALAATSAAAADVWKIDPVHSSAEFAVTHFMISTVRGRFGTMSGTVTYDGHDVASIRVEATIDVASIATGNDGRDKDLRSDHFFDVAKYPTITFKSTKVVSGRSGSFQLVGNLTMHGVTREVTLDVKGPSPVIKGMRGESRVAATATTTIDRRNFGMKYNATLSNGGLIVSNKVAITLDIEAVQPPAGTAAPAKK